MKPVDYLNLTPGQVLEAGVLMPGLGDERIVHVVESVNDKKTLITVVCYYYGIFMGRLVGMSNKDGTSMMWSQKFGAKE